MKNNIFRFEIYVNDELRFIKNSLRDKNIILSSLKNAGIGNVSVKETKLY